MAQEKTLPNYLVNWRIRIYRVERSNKRSFWSCLSPGPGRAGIIWLKSDIERQKNCFKIDSNMRSFLWTRIVRYYRFEKSISKSASDLILIFEDFGFCFFWILQSPSRFPRLPSSRISKLVDFRLPRENHLESEYIFTLMSFYGLGKQNNLDVINVTFFVMIQLPSSAEFIASKFKNVVFRWQVSESGIVSLIFLRLRNLAHHFIIQ